MISGQTAQMEERADHRQNGRIEGMSRKRFEHVGGSGTKILIQPEERRWRSRW